MAKESTGILNMESIRKLPMEMKLIYFYRYFSYLLTSVFYLFIISSRNYEFKPMVAVFLGVAAIILNNIYIKHKSLKGLIFIMIALETISNVVILIPTGGLNSPYIWYSLNTVLVSAYFFSAKLVYFNQLTYLSSITIISYLVFSKSQQSFIGLINSNSNLILSLILITFTIQSLMKVTKRLTEERKILTITNEELSKANKMIHESMEHIGSLYQSVQSIANIKNEEKLIEIITKFTKDITKTELAFSCISGNRNKYVLKTSNEIEDSVRKSISKNIRKEWDNQIVSDDVFYYVINDKNYMAVAIKSFHMGYGILGIEIGHERLGIIEQENIKQLKYLASLSAITLERFKNEEMNKLLLISEEQNRIANEMHDSVSQRLFFISGKVYSLIKENNKSIPEIKQELVLVKDALIIAMKELRKTIHCYSSKHDGITLFEKNISEYINGIIELHDVNIQYSIMGSQERIGYDLKKAIYRILSEAIGNAIRHGKCNNITIALSIEKDRVRLRIDDDGIGFDLESRMKNKNAGLGLKNLHNLTYYFEGEIAIDSQINHGTSIQIEMPICISSNEQGEVV